MKFPHKIGNGLYGATCTKGRKKPGNGNEDFSQESICRNESFLFDGFYRSRDFPRFLLRRNRNDDRITLRSSVISKEQRFLAATEKSPDLQAVTENG